MKQTKKLYETPSMELMLLSVEDIVTLSDGGTNTSGSNGSSSYEELFGGEW